jgi:hypothetical protein
VDDPGFESHTGKSFFSPTKHPEEFWVPPSFQFNGTRGFFSGVKWLGCEVNHSPQSSAKVKNEYSYTSTPPICFHGIGRENFTFYIQHTCSNVKIGTKNVARSSQIINLIFQCLKVNTAHENTKAQAATMKP